MKEEGRVKEVDEKVIENEWKVNNIERKELSEIKNRKKGNIVDEENWKLRKVDDRSSGNGEKRKKGCDGDGGKGKIIKIGC